MDKKFWQEKLENRSPRKPTLDDKMYYFRQMRNDAPDDLQANLDELKEFAAGKGDSEIRQQWYPGWFEDDFRELLDRLEEEGISE